MRNSIALLLVVPALALLLPGDVHADDFLNALPSGRPVTVTAS